MSRLRTMMAEKLGAVLDDVKGDLQELWQVEVKEALEDVAELTLQRLTLTDAQELKVLDRELLHAKARIANWTFVGADLVRERLKKVLHETAELVGAMLKGFIK